METTTDTTLYIVTADKIAATGTITWKFMFDADLPKDFENAVLNLPWGWVWDAGGL